MEEGVADAATGGGMDGEVEEGHGAAPASSSGDHGGQAKGGHGGMKQDGQGAAPEGGHGGEVEDRQGAASEGGHGGEVEGGQGAAPEGGHGGEVEGGQGATATDASTPAWLEGPWILHVSTLLKATVGRPKTERYKGCGEKKKKKRPTLMPYL
ncbi:uncharacterized protein [Aegilops tauschii subsp. strangulata]|uniref:uncharacterized protein isoform X1 n=1 Tax=Aegilops tauschii subsp. strangulata TaxID=200361 RepID=UPI003CC84C38